MTVRAQVQARMALGQLDDARESGEGALAWLGDRVPQMQSLILTTLATALREVGRVEEAYDALQRACELERQAFRELSQVQLSLERATVEAREARRHSELLTAKNRQLAEAHNELERRADELETRHAATAACERTRRAVNSETWSSVADGLSVTTSLGVATTDRRNDLEAVMRLADQRLYEAKRNGRDRVVSAT